MIYGPYAGHRAADLMLITELPGAPVCPLLSEPLLGAAGRQRLVLIAADSFRPAR